MLFALLLAATPELDIVLDRATEAHERARPLYEDGTYSLKMVAEELDKKGKPTSTTEVETKGDELIRYVEDGKDVTQEKKAKRKEPGEKRGSVSLGFGDPFSKESRPHYAFTLVKIEEGRATIAFAPKGKKSPEIGVGTAVVDVETGALRSLEFRPSAMPKFVSKLDIAITCDEQTPLGWAMSKMSVQGEGGMLFVKKRFRMTSTFSDWRAK